MFTGDGEAFGLFCHTTAKRSSNELTVNDVRAAGGAGDYAIVQCVGGQFMIGGEAADVLTATCKYRMEPRINRLMPDDDEPCASVGADGRTDDLVGHVHTIEVGFQIGDSFSRLVSTY